MSEFPLDSRLEADSVLAAHYRQTAVRLMKTEPFFWVLLIPERTGITEWHDLNSEETRELTFLIHHISKGIKLTENADKINIGALGNIVPQFHFHIIARAKNDTAWPGPVWGSGPFAPASDRIILERCERLRAILAEITAQA